MGYPKYMTDEQLFAFGFEPTDDDPRIARHKLYPRQSVRYRCPSCSRWSSNLLHGLCRQCFVGRKAVGLGRQFEKVYECCGDAACDSWQAVLSLIRAYGLPVEQCHDGNGAYVRTAIPNEWPEGRITSFHADINEHTVSKHGARTVQCARTGSLRSKLPKKR